MKKKATLAGLKKKLAAAEVEILTERCNESCEAALFVLARVSNLLKTIKLLEAQSSTRASKKRTSPKRSRARTHAGSHRDHGEKS